MEIALHTELATDGLCAGLLNSSDGLGVSSVEGGLSGVDVGVFCGKSALCKTFKRQRSCRRLGLSCATLMAKGIMSSS